MVCTYQNRIITILHRSAQPNGILPVNTFLPEANWRARYLIKSGRVLVTTSLGDGRMLTFSVLKKGSIFGDGAFADHYLREVDISAVTDVEVIVCETKDLLPLLCENQALLLMLLRHMAELSNEMAHQLVRLAHYDGKQKVVDYILVNAGATGSLPYTHNDIANCLS